MIYNIDLGYQPRKWQDFVHRNRKQYNCLICHRRSGKTILAMMELIHECLMTPKTRFAYVAPYLKQARSIMWDILKAKCEMIPHMVISESDMRVKAPNGSTIQLFGADNCEALRGLGFNGAILDEFADFDQHVFGQVIIPTLAADNGWLFVLGTPKGIDPLTVLYRSKSQDNNWFTHTLSALDSGALSQDVLMQMKENMTPAEWELEMLCNFDAPANDALIAGEDVERAFSTNLHPFEYKQHAKVIGADIARFGDDSTVIVLRQGPVIHHIITLKQADSITIAEAIIKLYVEEEADAIFLDGTGGFAGGIADHLRNLGYECTEIHFNSKASTPRYSNKRSEMWFELAAQLRRGMQIKRNTDLKVELTAPRYIVKQDSVLAIEPKDEIKSRISRSPDTADAIALTFAMPVQPATRYSISNRRTNDEWEIA